MGGMGVRPNKDGIDTTDHDGSNVYHVPLRSVKLNCSLGSIKWNCGLIQEVQEKWRGGLGFYSEVEWLKGKASASFKKRSSQASPWGLAGGYSGPECKTALRKKDVLQNYPRKKSN